jgi:hypothetical protein
VWISTGSTRSGHGSDGVDSGALERAHDRAHPLLRQPLLAAARCEEEASAQVALPVGQRRPGWRAATRLAEKPALGKVQVLAEFIDTDEGRRRRGGGGSGALERCFAIINGVGR